MNAIPATKTAISIDYVWSVLSFTLAAAMFAQFLREGSSMLFAFMILDLQAGYLFWIRSESSPLLPVIYRSSRTAVDRAEQDKPWSDLVAILSMVLVVFYEVRTDCIPGQSALGEFIAIFGALICFISAWSLGSSYGVMPRYRGIKTRGAYSAVRHPLYASIIVMEAGYVMVHPTARNLVLALLGFALILLRIHFEERLLSHSAEYEAYKSKVRYRLLPALW